ncbi:MAG: BatA domain-containing protein [Gemmataceae bacterium]
MSELFLNPWSMAAGAALIASPIVIHFINRIRYRRVRWAAMEFLLKAQKRVRRKLLIQQLLLLLLRVLLVLLIGLLVGRFLGFDFAAKDTRSTQHLVLIDDTPSMADGWRADVGTQTDAFEQAKQVLVTGVAPAAAQATTPQTLDLMRLSDLTAPRPFGRLNPDTIRDLKTHLDSLRPGLARVSLADGVKAAAARLSEQPADVAKVLHIVSDFRAGDWSEDGEAVKKTVGELTAAGVKVFLVDVVHPHRKKDDRRPPAHHDNLGITELTPARPVTAKYDPVEFTLRVRNFGAADLSGVRVAVKINGQEGKGRSVQFPVVPGGQERAARFELTFDTVATPDRPLDRFSLVTASVDAGEPGGLVADNVRHAVVEVKDRLPVLVVEGRPQLRESKEGDGFYLRPLLNVVGGYQWVDGAVRDLETGDLGRFAFVMLLNVLTLSDAAAKNLDGLRPQRRRAGVFLGPDVSAKDYNDRLYRDGAGVLPAPLADAPSSEPTEEELRLRRFRITQKKLLVKDPVVRGHPALAGLYLDDRGNPAADADKLERVFGFITVKRHWPVRQIGAWRDDKAVTELYFLPNDRPMADFEAPLRRIADALPVRDPAFAKYKDALAPLQDELRRLAASSDPLYRAAAALDDLLADQRAGDAGGAAVLREFWANSKMADLKADAMRVRDSVKFGDPFYLTKLVGRGRVTLVTTTAGETWTDWPSEQPGNASFGPIVKEMGAYLAGSGGADPKTVGSPIEIGVPADRYQPVARRAFRTHDPLTADLRAANPDPAPLVDLKEQPLIADGNRLVLKFTEANAPGVYLFTLTDLKPPAGGTAPEYRAVAVNLDPREGDFRRVAGDDLAYGSPGARVVSPADADWLAELKNKRADLSESVWLFLLLLAILMAEQWLAVRLSYHAVAAEQAAVAPSAVNRTRPADTPAVAA